MKKRGDADERRAAGRSRRMLKEGKAPTTAAGPFVELELDHVKEGKHGARSKKQAVAIGLSKARKHGVPYGAKRASSRRRGTRR